MCFKICQSSASVLKFEILPWCEPIPQIKGNICKKIKWNATDLHVNVNDCCQICKLATKRAQRGINLAFTAATKWDLCVFFCDAKWCRYILQILKYVCIRGKYTFTFKANTWYQIWVTKKRNLWDTKKHMRYKNNKQMRNKKTNIGDTKKKNMRYKK